MKQQVINQENSLITKSSFSGRQCSIKGGPINENTYTAEEELQKACWSGLLNEWLPELIGLSSIHNGNFTQSIVRGAHSLCNSIGPCPMPEKNGSSIDPQFFLHSLLYN